MFTNIVLIIIGFIFLIKGAEVLVEGASGLAKRFHIPEIIIGLTVVSIGTSMPELFVSLTAAVDGYQDMAIGNVVGSNISNLLLIVGLSAILRPLEFQKSTKFIDIPICFATTIIFMILANIGQGISRLDAAMLSILFAAFIIYTIYMAKSSSKMDTTEEKETKERKTIWNILFILLGIVGLKFGADFVVDNAVSLARIFNVSEKMISLTIIALGTSLPELVTSVVAAAKGSSDISIGNIIGSNIFNLLFVIGLPGIINPINYSISYNVDMTILVVSIIMLAIFANTGKKIV